MRVLFLASYFPRPTVPLAGTWALEQAKALAAVVDLEVACCTPWVPSLLRPLAKARPWIDVPQVHQWGNVTARYYKTLHYPVRPFKAWAFRDPSRQMSLTWRSVEARLRAAVDRFRPDVLFCHHTAVNGYLAHRLQMSTGLPYVITDHDFDEITACERLPRRWAFFQRILATAHRHLCVSRRMEADVRRLFPSAPTQTLHNGVTPPPPDRSFGARPPDLSGKLVVLSAAMLYERKGMPLLIEAFGRLLDKHGDAVLRIAGDGQQLGVCREAIEKHGLRGRVQMLGRLSHDDVLREMSWCDVFALVGWDEPFGVVYLEAMSMGKPIVACADSGIAEVVEDGVHGFLVRPRDQDDAAAALDRLLSSQEQRTRMGENAARLIRDKLTWTANTETLVSILRAASR